MTGVSPHSRLCSLMLLLVILMTGAAFSQEKTTRFVMPNGLTVLLREDHSSPAASLYIVYRVGSRNERPGITGISHLLEHMLFRGTKKYPPGAISRLLDVAGADFNAFTTYDITGYYETLPARQLPLAMEIESDRMHNCTLSPEIMKQEKAVVLSELEGYDNSPREVLQDEVRLLHFSSHPYRWPIGGFKSDVEGLKAPDLMDYYSTYYSPRNAIIAIVGDIKISETSTMVEKYFGNIPGGPEIPPVRSIEPAQLGEKRIVISRKGKTSYLEASFHTPPIRDHAIYSLAIMDNLLAKGKSSQLYRALVESGLATRISSSLWENHDPGMYSIIATVAPGKSHLELEEALLNEIEAFKKAPIEERDLKKARNQVKASFFKTKESLTLQAESLSWYEAVDTYRFIETYLSRIEEENQERVHSVAKKYLTETNRTIGWFCAQAGENNVSRAEEGTKGRLLFKKTAALVGAALPPVITMAPQGSGGKSISGKTSRHVLPNGLTVIIRENHCTPTVSLAGYVKAGSAFDPAGKEGLSYFTAAMLDRGAGKRSCQDIAGELEFLGASLSFTGEREITSIEGWSMAENLDSLLPILADTLINPTFPAEEEKRMTQDILSQLNRQADDPQNVALIAQREMIYPARHPFHSNTKGYPQSIAKILRDDCLGFHKNYYRPDLTVLIFVGDVQTEKLLLQVSEALGKWKAPEAVPPPKLSIPPVEPPKTDQKKIIIMKDKAQVAVAMGNAGISRGNSDYYAFDLLNSIIGGNTLTSRLGEELRDKEGLVYFVWSYQVSSQGEAPWLLLYGTHEKNVGKSIEATRAVIKNIQTVPVSDHELNDARNAIINKLTVSLQTNSSVADFLKEIELFNLGEGYLESIPARYRTITSGDLLRVAKKYIHPDRMTMVIAGPCKEP
jgi:zinc protease